MGHGPAELGLHVDDALPGGEELLRGQVAQAARAFHRPGTVRPLRRPLDQPPGLREPARTLSWASGVSAASIATAVCDSLCGSTPIITAAIPVLLLLANGHGVTAAGMSDFSPQAVGPFSSHATAGPGGRPLVIKPGRQ